MTDRDISMTCYARRNSSDNPNAKRVDIGPITIWFSYTTPIAFHVPGAPKVVRQNQWGPTTGKHLNAIDGGGREAQASRVDEVTFNRLLGERIGRFFFPRDLDADCPAPIVADWLQDRGLDKAAELVRQTA